MKKSSDILKRHLGVFFAEEGRPPEDVVKQILIAVAEKLKNTPRVLMMPAGPFAVAMAARLADLGIYVLGFLDNFKAEGAAEAGRVFRPSGIGDIDFDAIVIATPSINAQEAMKDQLSEIMPSRIDDYHILLDIVGETFKDSLSRTADRIGAEMKRGPDGRRICITSPFLHHNHLKLMYHLKLRGFHVTVIAGNERLNGTVSIHDFKDKGFYDHCHISYYYDVVMPRLLKRLDFDLIHAIATTASPMALAKAAKEKKGTFLVEYCDFKELLFDNDEAYLLTMTENQLARENRSWRDLFLYSDGLIIKDSPEIIGRLSEKYGVGDKPWIQFMSYPSRKFMRKDTFPAEKYSAGDGRMHVVYAGTVLNTPQSHPYPHHRSLLEIAGAFDSQGIAFTIINAVDNTGDDFGEYLAMKESLPLFDYQFAMPHDRLSKELSRYDIGWFGFDFSNAVESDFFRKTTFASKVFNYMEAGLPILVSREVDYMCRWIEERGIGAGILFSEMNKIGDIIRRLDFDDMGSNIAFQREGLAMERQIDRLVDFYTESCLGN